MANIEHKLIVDADRHEPKGASSATVKQALLSNGDGTTYFGFVNYSDLSGKPAFKGYKQILYGASAASSQDPTATNTPLGIEFGTAQSLTDASLDSTGVLTLLTPGDYLFEVSLRLARPIGSGSVILYTRAMYNGAQILASSSATLTDVAAVIPVTHTILVTAVANDTFKMQVMRDSTGLNQGGLKQDTPTAAGWNASPTANISVYKYVGSN
jgi:hypothetical protein